ncbi:hypothetical protein [Rickettsia endosymbiont of Ixodes pacificus]|uniref:hypothetical protein n=1 Tax=Rickettsia endosymbiont of Ixodes pacificus TaxID=1133329 RepID=UPI000A821499|nr:hypothetical protein [Rickettsia endosymbiont of Ixodes pacificus]
MGTTGIPTFVSLAPFGFLIPANFCSSPIFAASLLPLRALFTGFVLRFVTPFEVLISSSKYFMSVEVFK